MDGRDQQRLANPGCRNGRCALWCEPEDRGVHHRRQRFDRPGRRVDRVELVALAIFIILGSITVIVPVTWRLASPDRSSAVLATWHDWLVRNNAVVMAILLLVFGAHLVGNGVTALVS